MENKMFCFQCQETAGCKGCTHPVSAEKIRKRPACRIC